MKKIFLFLFGLAILACSPKITTYGGENRYDNETVKEMDEKISMAQFDSLCITDTLPRKLSDWYFLGIKKHTTLFSYLKDNGVVYEVKETMDDSVSIRKKKIVILDE